MLIGRNSGNLFAHKWTTIANTFGVTIVSP